MILKRQAIAYHFLFWFCAYVFWVYVFRNSTLVLTHASAPLAKRLCEQRNADVIAEALKDALGVNWRVRCESGAPSPAEIDPLPARPARVVPPPPEVDTAQRKEREEQEDRGDQEDEEDEEGMLAEAGRSDPSTPRRDPEEVALELLQNELGARRIDGV